MTVTFALLSASAACKKNTPPATPGDAAAVSDAGASAPVDRSPVAIPSEALVAVRGSGLRKVLNLIAPGAPARAALGQILPGITAGVGEHALDVDPDGAFAGLVVPPDEGTTGGQLSLMAAWPLRSGMQIAQDALALRGFREVRPGVYEPTTGTTDAGRGAPPCWVARRQPVGWVMLCGPRGRLSEGAQWLVRASESAPTPDTVLDVTVRPEPARRIFALQVAALESQDPRRNDAGTNRERVAQFDDVLRGARNTRQLVDDLSALHATLTVDDGSYHLRGDADFAHADGQSTRALLGAAVGRRAALDLLQRLPNNASAYMALGFDMAAFAPLLAPPERDPRTAAALGPEFVRFQEGLTGLTGFRRSGERVMGYLAADGGSKIEIIRMTDPARAITELRALAAAVPRTARPSGIVPASQFAILPPGAGVPAGALRMRLGPDPAQLPPNVPADVRRMYQRTVLMVPIEGALVLIESGDPTGRWTAMQSGEHLAVNTPGDPSAVVHLTGAALLGLLGVPAGDPTQGSDPVDGVLTSRRVGDAGGHFDLRLDAPIATVNHVRDTVAQLQAQAAEMQQRTQAARQQGMQQAQQAQQAARRMQRGGGMMLPTPTSPDQLPEPNFQLRPPPQ